MDINLPIHPTLRHPLTGAPLQAVYVTRDGRPKWPIMGAAEGDDAAAAQAAADAAAKATADAAAAKAAADAAAAAKTGNDADKDLGFPKDTPVVEMTAVQQAAYYKHQARKHEERATEYRTAAGGKTAAEVKADLDAAAALAREKMTDQQKAIEDAKTEAQQNAAREYAPKAARTAFEFALSHLTEADRAELIDTLDLTKVITDSGDVDTAKVRSIVEKIAPAGKGGERRLRDFGAGDRTADKTTGVASGRSLFEERRGKKSTTT